MANAFWILFDSSTQKSTQPLSEAEVTEILKGLKHEQIQVMFIWTEGWKEWQPLPDFMNPFEDTFILPLGDMEEHTKTNFEEYSGVFTKISRSDNANLDYGYWFQDFQASSLTLKSGNDSPEKKVPLSAPSERRISKRHEFKIEILIMDSRGRIFKTQSENISLSGTLVADAVPLDLLRGHFELVIVNKLENDPSKARIFFKGRVVGDISNPCRLMFVDPDNSMSEKLNKMFDAYTSAQKALHDRKTVA